MPPRTTPSIGRHRFARMLSSHRGIGGSLLSSAVVTTYITGYMVEARSVNNKKQQQKCNPLPVVHWGTPPLLGDPTLHRGNPPPYNAGSPPPTPRDPPPTPRDPPPYTAGTPPPTPRDPPPLHRGTTPYTARSLPYTAGSSPIHRGIPLHFCGFIFYFLRCCLGKAFRAGIGDQRKGQFSFDPRTSALNALPRKQQKKQK